MDILSNQFDQSSSESADEDNQSNKGDRDTDPSLFFFEDNEDDLDVESTRHSQLLERDTLRKK